jgi:lambda repressor-like predicted transcriptional regulator
MITQRAEISKEQAKKIQQYILKGNSYADAAKKFGYLQTKIAYCLKKHGLALETHQVYKNRTSLSDDTLKTALALLRNGMSIKDVCLKINAHNITLKRALKIKGIKIDLKWRRPTKDKIAQAIKLYKNGLTTSQVSKETGITTSALYTQFKAKGKRPATDFKLTPAQTSDLVNLLRDGMDTTSLAVLFSTRRAFIDLAIVKLGSTHYFAEVYRSPPMKGDFSDAKIQAYIAKRFKGESNAKLAAQMETTRVTLDKILVRIKANYMRLLLERGMHTNANLSY